MTDRTVKVRLQAAVQGYQAAMARASASTKEFGREVAQTSRKSQQEMQTLGTAFAVAGGAITAVLALSGKAAIDFESSFAGVRKTVNATEPEFARLASGMRDMARSIPTNVNELNAIGESAGQLGIQTQHLLGFTRTMADLGETTNLSSEQAATSLARLANITQLPQTEFDRLGSTIVALGNQFATTESEIVDMGMRLAGAGSQIGMTEPQILGLAAALTSVGIEAEAGGSALSKVMIEIASQVETGGDKLETFAQVAGMSAGQFSAAFEEDAAGALVSFVTGLGDMEEQGGSTLQTLEDLEITEVRMRDALLRASGAGDLLNRTMDVGTDAFRDNNALTDEAAQRYETVAARIDIARNAVNDAAISIGQGLSPAVGWAADSVADFAGAIADLPAPVTGAATGVGALAGAASLAAGGFLLAAPRIVATKDALTTLRASGGRIPAVLSRVRGGLVGATGITAALVVTAAAADSLADSLKSAMDGRVEDVDDLRNALMALGDDLSDSLAVEGLGDAFGAELEGLTADLDRLSAPTTFEKVEDFLAAINPLADAPGAERARERIGALDQALTQIAENEGPERAARQLGLLADAANLNGDELTRLQSLLPEFNTAIDTAAVAAGDAAGATDGLVGALGPAGEEFDGLTGDIGETVTALEAYLDRTQKATDPVYALSSALQAVEEAQAAYTEAVDKHGAGSEEARAAAWDLTEAVSAAETAAVNGDLSFDEFSRKLAQWVSMGVITADQANATRARVAELRGEAERYEGGYLASIGLTGYGSTLQQLEDLAIAADRVGQSIHVRVSGTTIGGRTQHAGGWAGSGPIHRGALKPDEIPAVLQTGEFVLSRDMVTTLKALPRFHDGGSVDPLNLAGAVGGVVSSALSGGEAGSSGLASTIEQVRRMIADAERFEQDRQDEGRRAEMVEAIRTAEGPEQWAEATRALQKFDRERVIAAQAAAAADEMARLEAELRIATNREEFEFAQMSSREQIQMLSAQMAAERKYTDAYMSLHSKRQQLIDAEIDAARARADTAMDTLNQMLDDRQKVLDQIARAERDHRDEVRSIQQGLSDDIARMMDDRRRQLADTLPLDSSLGYDAGTLSGVLGEETERLQEWASSLDQLRGRGLDERVVELLGLDSGPEAIHQVTQLLDATDEELAELNRTALERERAIGQQVADERHDQTTELGRSIADATREHDRQIAQLQRDFAAEQARLTAELNQIGRDQGRSFNESIAQGLASGLPAIRRQVDEALKMFAELGATQAQYTDGVMHGDPGRSLSSATSTVTIGDLRVEAPSSGNLADYEEAARRVVAGALQGVNDQYLAGAS